MELSSGSSVSHLFLAKRENNPAREYILVNTRQAKHFPSDPVSTLELFEELGRKAAQDGRADKPTVVIAFAETATAIGAVVSGSFHDCFFVTTTRERLPDWATAITFEESHSHAKQHYLCVRDEDMFRRAKQVVLVDDEFTTGRTAVNLVRALDGCLAPDCCVYAAGLAASAESLDTLREADITPIVLADSGAVTNTFMPESFSPDRELLVRRPASVLRRNSILDPRLGVSAEQYLAECQKYCAQLADKYPGGEKETVEVVGTEEFCYPPLLLGKFLSEKYRKVVVHCTTRSPMLPFSCRRKGFGIPAPGTYPIVNRTALHSVYDPQRTVYLYNTSPCDLCIIMTDAERPGAAALSELCGAARGDEFKVVLWRSRTVPTSYSADDVKLLLMDMTGKLQPLPPEEREKLIQGGRHYSELLPQEYEPSREYLREYENGLKLWAKPVADAVRTVAEAIWAEKGRSAVLVSLARAGTPAGVLIKRYIRKKYGVSLPHYSISIIIGRGIDKRAMDYILARHSAENIQFIDGWTGKGMITRTLRQALEEFPFYEYGVGRDKLDRLCELAVLADPAGLCRLCGTHDDLFIPCACLNSVVSGLFSRTILGRTPIPGDFHGAVYFREFKSIDRTYDFINAIESEMTYGPAELPAQITAGGYAETQEIAEHFGVGDIRLVKPGIGEATRVLLRRVPELILLRDISSPMTRHLVELAQEKGVEVREYPLRNYHACGLIKAVSDV